VDKGLSGSITVFAAASLTDSFQQIGRAFTNSHPNAKVTFSFDASSALAQQIARGAPADVFASADTTSMGKLTKAALTGSDPVIFAKNSLAIIVPKGTPPAVATLADLGKPGLKVVLCAEEVPCGKYARQVLADAGVRVTPASLEQNVKGVVTKVTAGEADAGIVYVTDAQAAAGRADIVAIPADQNAVAAYPIARTRSSRQAGIDAAFIAFVLGPEGQGILKQSGFQAP
jgi:molybdate transport system substrate-binding protein